MYTYTILSSPVMLIFLIEGSFTPFLSVTKSNIAEAHQTLSNLCTACEFSHNFADSISPASERIPKFHPIKGFGLPLIQTASASQNGTNNIPRENPEDWRPYLAHKVNRRKRGFRTKPSHKVTAHVY